MSEAKTKDGPRPEVESFQCFVCRLVVPGSRTGTVVWWPDPENPGVEGCSFEKPWSATCVWCFSRAPRFDSAPGANPDRDEKLAACLFHAIEDSLDRRFAELQRGPSALVKFIPVEEFDRFAPENQPGVIMPFHSPPDVTGPKGER